MPAFAIVHDLLSGIENAPSGTATFYLPNTLTPTSIFGDDVGTGIANPVTLDSNGRAAVYLQSLARMIVKTVLGVTVVDTVINAVGDTTVISTSGGFTGGTLGSIGTAALAAFGGPDFRYQANPAGGTVGQMPQNWMNGVLINVMGFASIAAPNINDGVTPAGTAIAAAIAFAASLGGGVVYFPPGTYLISAPIGITGVNGVSLRGSGRITSTIKNTNTGGNAITVTSCSGFAISDLGIAHSTASTAAGVQLASCGVGLGGTVVIDSVNILGHRTGISMTGSTSSTAVRTATIITPNSSAAERAIQNAATGTHFWTANCFLSGGISAGGSGIELSGSAAVHEIVGNSLIGSGGSLKFNSAFTGNTVMVAGNYLANGVSYDGLTTEPFAVRFACNHGLDGTSVTQAVTGAVTPNRALGDMLRINATGSGITVTVNLPTPTPNRSGVRFHFRLFNNNAGVTAWALTNYRLATGVIGTAAGVITEIEFEWDADRSLWNEVSRSAVS